MFQLKSKSTNSLNNDTIQPNLIKTDNNFSILEKYSKMNLSVDSIDSIDSVERRDSAISDITVNDSKDNLPFEKKSEPIFNAGIDKDFIKKFNSKCRHYNDNVIILNLEQSIELINYYYSSNNELDSTTSMFPYLHGLTNSRQRIFFNKQFKNLNNDSFDLNQYKKYDFEEELKLKQFHLMILNSQDEDFRLTNSIDYKKVLSTIDTTIQSDGDLNNRNFKEQLNLYGRISQFVIYNNHCQFDINLKAALEISLQYPSQKVYIMDFNFKMWKNFPMEYLNEYNFEKISNLPINSVNNKVFNCKLLKWEQNLLWKFNSMKWLNKNICLGNLIDFNYINNLPKNDFDLIINCNEFCSIPKVLDSNYIEFPSSGYLDFNHCNLNDLINYLNFLKLIEKLVHENKNIFIFSFDGFTGLTLLTLSISLILGEGHLEDLILQLYERNDYIKLYYFKNDLVFLKKFEKFIFYGKNNFKIGEKLNFINYNHLPITKINNKVDWFNYNKDNNFPCKIFKNLYLGSLNHANSEIILKTMKFNRIISIGEKPKWVNYEKKNLLFSYLNEQDEVIEIFELKIKDPELPHLKLVIFINNLKDDGKDRIYELLMTVPKHIQSKYLINPNDLTKTLFHCRIGVSRSASLVIACLMKYQKLSLIESYMIVRINRFNIIIQPNLRIFYDLYLYDDHLSDRRLHTWYSLCDEIYKLNRNYIG